MKKEKKRLIISCAFFAIFLVAIFSITKIIKISEKKHYIATLNIALRSGIHADVITELLPEFEDKFNIKCNVKNFSEDELRNQIISDVTSDSGIYDLCMIDGSWTAEFIANKIATDLTDIYQLDDDIIEATKAVCYNDGKLYMTPYYGNVTVLLYNKLLVREAGCKDENIDTIEEMLKICQEVNKHHNLGFLYRGDTENNIVVDFLPVLLAHNGWVLDKNNKPSVNTPEWHKAMETYLKLIETGRPAKKEDLIAAITNKTAAMAIAWPGWYTPAKNSTIDYKAFNGKLDDSSPSYNATIYGIWTLGIPSSSRNKKYAGKLLNFIMDSENQKESVFKGGVPCRYSSLSDPEVLKKFPQYDAVRKALETGVYRPQIKEWPEFYTILGKEMRLIINGKKTIDEGLADAQSELEKLMNSK